MRGRLRDVAIFKTSCIGGNQTQCKKRIDLGFLLDSSGSIGLTNFDKTKAFVKDLIAYFKISQNNTRISVISYASTSILHFFFSQKFLSPQDLYTAIDNISYSGGGTNTHEGLMLAYKDMFNGKNDVQSPETKKILIVFTDGQIHESFEQPSQELKNIGVVIYSIGIGSGIDVSELETMASPASKDHVFLLRNFYELSALEQNISYSACNDDYECYRCGIHASCLKTNGSLHCICNVGFVGDGYSCTDVNECQNGTNVCNRNASCNNTIGSFNCLCNTGYIGDGITCRNVTICTKKIDLGFLMDSSGSIRRITRILIVLTDGKSTGNVHYPSQQLKNMGVVIFSIGVGSGIDILELETMASSPAKDRVFLIHNFNEFADLAHNMSFDTCNGNTTNITRGLCGNTSLHTPGRLTSPLYPYYYARDTDYSCGNTYLHTPGRLTSPRYPYVYPKNTNCSWVISSANAKNVWLQFLLFWIEDSSRCQHDYLDIYDGNSVYAKKLGRFCGKHIPKPLVSSGSMIFIVFYTDYSIQKQGFVLNHRDTNDTNNCTGASCGPYANCAHINGSYICVCKPGYKGNGTNCTGITAT
ncbi:cubilin-like [Dendronephthya gigantea]|uniref:cubilin-like n=1 Tax=Dendronephthya gigantea TaxID=151771 RepID=UPI00106CF912|nr:cubilin-like [Dendronephthya gigantea]